MAQPFITKTVRITPELNAEIEAAIASSGSKTFSDFCQRGLHAELELERLRQHHLKTLATNRHCAPKRTPSKHPANQATK